MKVEKGNETSKQLFVFANFLSQNVESKNSNPVFFFNRKDADTLSWKFLLN